MGIFHNAVKTSHSKGLATEWNDDHKVEGNLDFRHYAAVNMVVENRTDWPAGPAEGRVIYRTDQHSFYVWNGTIWVSMTGPATVVVAIDGSGDTTDIQEGIDMLPAEGGVVYIKEGTYTLLASLEITTNNVSLIGAGKCTIITTLLAIDILSISSASNFYISQIQFDGNDWATNCIHLETATQGSISQCLFSDAVDNEIWLDDDCDYNLIENNHIGHGADYGILGTTSIHCVIDGNWFGGADLETIHLGLCQNSIISDNTFWGVAESKSIYIDDGKGTQITGNTMTSVELGIEVYDSYHISISANTMISNLATKGIYIRECEKISIMGNTIQAPGAEGIYLLDSKYSAITGNTISDAWNEAVKIESCSHIAISGESHENCGVNGTADTALTDDGANWTTRCSVTGCNIFGVGATYDWAIEENNANDDYNNIIANSIIPGTAGQTRIQGANTEEGHNI